MDIMRDYLRALNNTNDIILTITGDVNDKDYITKTTKLKNYDQLENDLPYLIIILGMLEIMAAERNIFNTWSGINTNDNELKEKFKKIAQNNDLKGALILLNEHNYLFNEIIMEIEDLLYNDIQTQLAVLDKDSLNELYQIVFKNILQFIDEKLYDYLPADDYGIIHTLKSATISIEGNLFELYIVDVTATMDLMTKELEGKYLKCKKS